MEIEQRSENIFSQLDNSQLPVGNSNSALTQEFLSLYSKILLH
jgi:hypothetical protein